MVAYTGQVGNNTHAILNGGMAAKIMTEKNSDETMREIPNALEYKYSMSIV